MALNKGTGVPEDGGSSDDVADSTDSKIVEPVNDSASLAKKKKGKCSTDSCTPFFLPLSQLQRWGETQKVLHTEWGNTFFDLFYVAAAYNLGNLLREDLSARGVLYLVALFFPIMNFWMYRMNFSARFEVPKDSFHNAFMTAQLLPLATAILHIQPVPILSDPEHNVDMFIFCLSMSVGFCLYIYILSEIMYCQRHMEYAKLFPESFHSCKQLIILSLPPFLCTLVATVYTGLKYFAEKNESDGERIFAASDKFEDGPKDDVAAWLLIGGTAANIISMACLMFGRGIVYGRRENYNAQDYSVPLNIDFAIHRYGEWTMILLGESILSLLIVDLSDGAEYYLIFFSGIVTVVLLEYLHFSSQPHEPDHHAFRVSRGGAFLFYYFMQLYSISLITFGASYKYFLWEAVFAEDTGDGERRVLFPLFERLLAGETTSLRYDIEDRQQRIANIFSGSLALVWLCLDVISISHQGVAANLERLHSCPRGKFFAALLVCLRVALIVFAATLSSYVTDPVTLALTGLAGIFAQLCLRFLGTILFPLSETEIEDEAIDTAITFAQARVRETEFERTHGDSTAMASRH